MMNPIIHNYNIFIDQGTDFEEIFLTEDLGLDSTYIVRVKKIYSTTLVATLEAEALSDTELRIFGSNEQTAIEPGKYQYDVVETKQSGRLRKVVNGLFIVEETISLPE